MELVNGNGKKDRNNDYHQCALKQVERKMEQKRKEKINKNKNIITVCD